MPASLIPTSLTADLTTDRSPTPSDSPRPRCPSFDSAAALTETAQTCQQRAQSRADPRRTLPTHTTRASAGDSAENLSLTSPNTLKESVRRFLGFASLGNRPPVESYPASPTRTSLCSKETRDLSFPRSQKTPLVGGSTPPTSFWGKGPWESAPPPPQSSFA